MKMNLTRFRRMIAARWWALAIVALLAILLATRLTDLRNDKLPDREAVAVVTFNQLPGEVSDKEVVSRVQASAQLARDVMPSFGAGLLNPLATWELAAVKVDLVTRQLIFIGRGDGDQEATERVTEFRQRFLDQNPLGEASDIDDQLARIATRLSDIQQGIADATPTPAPPPPPEEQAVLDAGQRAALEAQAGALRQQYASLTVELLDPVFPRTAAQIELARQRAFDQLMTIELQLAAEATTTATTTTVAPVSRDLVLLEAQSTQLQAAYQALFAQKLNLELSAEVEPIFTRDSSLDPASASQNAALALVVGLLVGAAALVLIDNARRLLWSTLDIEAVATLPEMPSRGWLLPEGGPWYSATRARPRKAAIQALRAVVDRTEQRSGMTIGITGMSVHPRDIQELAADLATSFAISGRTVLLIDANFQDPADLMEFGKGELTLFRLLDSTHQREVTSRGPQQPAAYEAEDAQVISDLKSALRRHTDVVNGLKAVPAGSMPADAPDLLARRRFALLLQVAAEMFDVVVVAGDDIDQPITHVLSQRLDSMILLGAAGRTTGLSVEIAARDFAARRAQVAGVVLLVRRRSWLRKPMTRLVSRSREMDRLRATRAPRPSLLTRSANWMSKTLSGLRKPPSRATGAPAKKPDRALTGKPNLPEPAVKVVSGSKQGAPLTSASRTAGAPGTTEKGAASGSDAQKQPVAAAADGASARKPDVASSDKAAAAQAPTAKVVAGSKQGAPLASATFTRTAGAPGTTDKGAASGTTDKGAASGTTDKGAAPGSDAQKQPVAATADGVSARKQDDGTSDKAQATQEPTAKVGSKDTVPLEPVAKNGPTEAPGTVDKGSASKPEDKASDSEPDANKQPVAAADGVSTDKPELGSSDKAEATQEPAKEPARSKANKRTAKRTAKQKTPKKRGSKKRASR